LIVRFIYGYKETNLSDFEIEFWSKILEEVKAQRRAFGKCYLNSRLWHPTFIGEYIVEILNGKAKLLAWKEDKGWQKVRENIDIEKLQARATLLIGYKITLR